MLIRPALVVLLTTAAGVLAQSPAKTPGDVTRHADYRQAQKAVNDGLAEAAVPRLEKLLTDPAWKGEPGHAARLLLAEALVRSRNGERAVALLTADGATDPVTLFWKGAAQASAGQLTAADQTLAALTMPFPLSSEAVLTRASVLTALGQSALVLEILKPLTSSTDTELATRSRLACAGLLMEGGRISEAESLLNGMKDSAGKYAPAFQYLQARASLLQNRAEAAAPVFAALAEGGRGITRDMRHAAALGYALATQRMGRSAEALATLEKLIGQSPAPPLPVLQNAFAAFEELNNPPTPEADSFLQNWARSTEPGLKTLANLALASILENGQRPAEALAAVRTIAADAPSGPLKAAALLREARLSMAAEDLPGARAALEKLRPIAVTPALRAWTSWMEGTMQFTEQRWKEAAREFTKAALESQQAASQAAAAYNAALAELRSGLHDPRTALGVLASVPADETEDSRFDWRGFTFLALTKEAGYARI